jgi:hypothetical protein
MKKLLLFATSLFLLNVSSVRAQVADKAPVIYGQAFTDGQVMSPGRLDRVMKNKQKINDFQMMGYVTEVCQKEGCWLRLSTTKTSDDAIFVKMKDHAFLVPKDLAGKMIVVRGEVVKKQQSVDEQKHYLEDAGATKEEINAITQAKEVYEMEASGVKVY